VRHSHTKSTNRFGQCSGTVNDSTATPLCQDSALLSPTPTSNPSVSPYGITLPATTRWWATIQPPLTDPAFTREDGHRTFALFEVIVKPEHQGHGIGRQIHDHLLATRSEQRVTTATHHGNTHARNTYTTWGYHHIGTRQPTPPAPLIDVYLYTRTPIRP
jgi:hypothetical protein